MTLRRYSLAWCLVAVVLLTGSYLAVLPLIAIDETRYVGVALEMWQHGALLVPRHNGAFYSQKPPLLFWLLQGGWAVFGVNAWWPRIAVSLFSLLAVGLTAILARVLRPTSRQTPVLAPIVLLGSMLWAVWTPAVMFDLILSAWVVLSVLGLAVVAIHAKPWGWYLTALGMGLGILTKGPVAVLHVLPLGLLAPWWHPRPFHGTRWYRRLALAVLGAALVALAWAIPAALRGGSDYASAIFWGQSAGRMVDSFAHQQPVWWYLATLPAVLFPWLWWGRVWQALAALSDSKSTGIRFLAAWALPVFLALSLISGKQIHYLMPLLPAVALLIAFALEDYGVARPSPWWDGAPITAVLLALAALTAWAPGQQEPRDWPQWVAMIPLWLPVTLGVLGILNLAHQASLTRRTVALASTTIAVVIAIMWGLIRPGAPWYDLSGAARVVAQAQHAGRAVAHLGAYHNRFRFGGRLQQPVARVNGDDVGAWACAHPDGLVVSYADSRPSAEAARAAVYVQPFRADWLVINPATAWRSDSCPESAKGPPVTPPDDSTSLPGH